MCAVYLKYSLSQQPTHGGVHRGVRCQLCHASQDHLQPCASNSRLSAGAAAVLQRLRNLLCQRVHDKRCQPCCHQHQGQRKHGYVCVESTSHCSAFISVEIFQILEFTLYYCILPVWYTRGHPTPAVQCKSMLEDRFSVPLPHKYVILHPTSARKILRVHVYVG